MRIETKTRVSEYELQMAEKPEDIIDYVKQRNNREVGDKIAVLLKDKKPLVMYLEIDGKLIHFDNTDDCFICTTALCQKVNYCENCPHGIPNEYYVICKRDNRKMSPYDFCSLSTDSDLYHPIGIGTIYKWGGRVMIRTHEIKLNKEYCDSVLYGDKKFEVRYNDRGYQTGDGIKFKPVDKFREINHPIADKLYRITYIHSGMGLEKDWVVFAIEDVGFEPPKVREELCR